MKVTYLGTTMLLFDDGIDQILFDCHVTRPSIPKFLFGKLTSDTIVCDRILKDFEINRLRAMFISHSHHDHILDAPYFAIKTECEFYGSVSALNVARGNWVREEKLHPFNLNNEIKVGQYTITVIPSLHSKPGFFNNDIGQIITEPFTMPAKKKYFKEGGSFDFLVKNSEKTFLIRPSYNYIKDQLDGICADVLFLGIAGISKDTEVHKKEFWKETVEKVKPQLIIPIHWDNFFSPLYGSFVSLPEMFEDQGKSFYELSSYCRKRKIPCLVQLPLTTIEI